jgi:hypothetical protein
MENEVMNEVAIGHQGALNFRAEGTLRSPDGTIDNLTVTAELQGLRASKNVYDFDGWSALLSFFEELALNWRGWDGNKEWPGEWLQKGLNIVFISRLFLPGFRRVRTAQPALALQAS